MDQIKIGKFIADCRKEKGITQSALAEKFGISDRAVSKWENGKCLPDAGIMIDLCKLLGISVTELLTGEKISMENYEVKAEQTIIELSKTNEENTKRLLTSEVIMCILGIIILVASTAACNIFLQTDLWRILSTIGLVIIFVIFATWLLKIEQKAGYYKCPDCGHRFVPTYKQVFFSPHIGWTRKMKCPGCGKKSWCKKVVSAE